MICAFCGHVSGVMDSQKDATKKMAEHIVDCEKHPLRNAVVMLAAKDAEVAKLVEAGEYFRTHDVGMTIHVPTWDNHAATLAAYDKEDKR